MTENVAYLTYNTAEEPLFLIHHVDTMVSVTGVTVLLNFKEVCILLLFFYAVFFLSLLQKINRNTFFFAVQSLQYKLVQFKIKSN